MLTNELLRNVVSEGTVVEVASPKMWDSPLAPLELVQLDKCVDKRKREFAAGRSCARLALGQLGFDNVLLLPDNDRVPRWPEGIVGSISHTDNCCLAVVKKKEKIMGLGVDIECISPTIFEIEKMVCRQNEQQWLATFDNVDSRMKWLTVIFSAKESVYKSLYPSRLEFMGFEDIEIEIDISRHEFVVNFVSVASPVPRVDGRYLTVTNHVFTCCEYIG